MKLLELIIMLYFLLLFYFLLHGLYNQHMLIESFFQYLTAVSINAFVYTSTWCPPYTMDMILCKFYY